MEGISPEHTQQALVVLQAVRIRLLMEAWMTILLVGVLAAAVIFQLTQLFQLRRVAALIACALGAGLRYLPSENALFFSYLITSLGVILLIKEVVMRPMPNRHRN